MQDATELLGQLSRREVTSTDLLEQHLERVTKLNPRINAVVSQDVAAARARAQEADEARERGESWGPLHGLPMTIKDSYEVVGMPTTAGAPELEDHRPKKHADAVQRLIDAGAIPFGKTNLPLFAGEWQSFNEVYGTTNNPWDTTRTPGGSSGGSAASLALGFAPLELGSDIGGSIRIPAHFCGVLGHKPTEGIISLRGHIPGPPGTLADPDMAVAGPMARSVRDLELALDVLAGPRPEEAAWSLTLPAAPERELKDYRVGVWLDDPLCPLESEVRHVLEDAITALEKAGMQVDRGATNSFTLEEYFEPYLRLLGGVFSAGIPEKLYRQLQLALPAMKLAWRVKPPKFTLPIYMESVVASHRQWHAANEKRYKLRQRMQGWFENIDILLMPVAPWAAFPHAQKGEVPRRKIDVPSGKRDYSEHLPWISLATGIGLPATSVPAGRTAGGLPVNLQVVGARYQDLTCLAFSREIERVLGGFEAPPLAHG